MTLFCLSLPSKSSYQKLCGEPGEAGRGQEKDTTIRIGSNQCD